MLKNYCLIAAILLVQTVKPAAITYGLGDRTGDNLASYCHARWIAYKLDIPFHYTPFKFSELLAFSKIHPQREDKKFKNIVRFQQMGGGRVSIQSLPINKESDTLYVVPFFPELRVDAIRMKFTYFDIDWNDQKFLSLLREEIKPLTSFPTLELPSDKIMVAVHLRKGSGPDGIVNKLASYPLRFLPDSFFIEQIKKLSEIFNNQPMHVYLFTDSKNTQALIERYKAQVNKATITFSCCQATHTNPDLNVLEDFFNLMKFDCIIRPDSHFSQIAAKLSHAKIIIYPTLDLKKLKKKHKKNRQYYIYPVIENREKEFFK